MLHFHMFRTHSCSDHDLTGNITLEDSTPHHFNVFVMSLEQLERQCVSLHSCKSKLSVSCGAAWRHNFNCHAMNNVGEFRGKVPDTSIMQ
jgi:hypothetical protein